MSVFIVFFVSLFALLCFVIGTVCKCVYALIIGSLRAIINAGSAAVLTFLAVIVLALLSPLVDGIIKNGFIETIGPIILMIVICFILGAIVAGFGSIFISIAMMIVDIICKVLGCILIKGMEWSEMGYFYSLEVIFDHVNED